MSAAYDAIGIVTRLERAAMRDGAKPPQAREAIARKIGVSPGTLQSIRRGRVKRLAHDIFQKLSAAMARQLGREIEAAAHELAILRAAGARMDAAALVTADEAVARARKAIERARQ